MSHRSAGHRVANHVPATVRIQHVRIPLLLPVVLAMSLTSAELVAAQKSPVAAPRPETSSATIITRQAAGSPLARLVTVHFDDVPLGQALNEINRQADLALAFTPRVVPVERKVSLQATRITAGAALTRVLEGTGVQVTVMPTGTVMLTRVVEGGHAPTIEVAEGAIYGVVTDSVSGEPIASVLVGIRGSSLRGTTDSTGRYTIGRVPEGRQVVTTKMMGFRQDEREVVVIAGQAQRIDFSLRYTQTSLQEVILTATGPRRRLELGSDIVVLNVDSIVRTQPVASVTDLLETRVPGLTIQRTSGAPGDPSRVRLRGATSAMMSNDPIVFVDGVRIYSEQSNDRAGNLAGCAGKDGCRTANYATPSPLDYMDINSIERIEVVKGPSAATMYGQDAANGVIVITTKKGRPGPPRWTVSAEMGTTEMVGRYPDLYLTWGHVPSTNAVVACPRIGSARDGFFTRQCDADSVVAFQMLSDPELTVLDRGQRRATTVGVSGGSSALTYSLQGSYRDEIGLVRLPQFEMQRYEEMQGRAAPDWMQRPQNLTQWSVNSRILAAVGAKANVSLSAGLTRTEQQRSSLEQQLGQLMSTFLDRSSGIYYRRSGSDLQRMRIDAVDEVLDGYYERALASATQFTNSASIAWQPTGWLNFSADAGLNIIQRDDEIFLPHSQLVREDSSGRLSRGQGSSVVRTLNTTVRAQRALGRGFTFRFATGANYTGQSLADLGGEAERLANGTSSLNQAGRIGSLRESRLNQATFGWYAEPALNHRRSWLSAGVRFDGATNFGHGLKMPRFPKLSYSYLLSDEPFFPWKELIPVLRLRVAYGQSGRQPGPTSRLRLYTATKPEFVEGDFEESVFLQTLGNTQLKPERTREMEGGFDADMFDDRLSLGVTGYHKRTFDMLLDVPVPPSVYGSNVSLTRNIGEVVNAGFEVSISAQPIRTEQVTWGTQLLVSRQRGHVVKLGEGIEPFYTSGNSEGGIRLAPGYPLFGRWVKPILGYSDANANGVLERDEVLLGDTAVYVGRTLPDFTAGAHSTLSLLRGALVLGASLSYQHGMAQRNEVAHGLAVFSRGWNDPAATIDEQAATFGFSEYPWIQTVSTLRLVGMSVTYNVPASVAQRLGARAYSISIQGSNLGLRTNYRGLDPAVNAFATGNNVVDTGVLPQPRTFQFRINATY